MKDEPTHQPARVVVGHCPKCEAVVVVFNNGDVWAPVVCSCGWMGDTGAVKNRQRLDRGGYIEGDPRIDPRSGRAPAAEPMHGPLGEVITDYFDQKANGVMRAEYEILGGHVHCRVFGPYSGKAGDLIISVDEWEHFQRSNPSWQFRARVRTESAT